MMQTKAKTKRGEPLLLCTLAAFLLTVGSVVIAGIAHGEVTVAPRHVMIIRPSVDRIVGSYIFALENRGAAPEKYSGTVLLPAETIDWSPVEGLEPSEVRLGEGGGLVIEKTVAPGTNLVLMGFEVKALWGRATLTLTPKEALQDLSILTPPGALMVSAPGTEPMQKNIDFSGHPFDRLGIASLLANQKVVVELTGIPQGRLGFWIAAAVVGALMLLLSSVMTIRTRPLTEGLY